MGAAEIARVKHGRFAMTSRTSYLGTCSDQTDDYSVRLAGNCGDLGTLAGRESITGRWVNVYCDAQAARPDDRTGPVVIYCAAVYDAVDITEFQPSAVYGLLLLVNRDDRSIHF